MSTPTEDPCLCGHGETDHDPENNGECAEVCACSGYTTNPEDSNLSHTARLKAEREAHARTRVEADAAMAEAARLREALEKAEADAALFAKLGADEVWWRVKLKDATELLREACDPTLKDGPWLQGYDGPQPTAAEWLTDWQERVRAFLARDRTSPRVAAPPPAAAPQPEPAKAQPAQETAAPEPTCPRCGHNAASHDSTGCWACGFDCSTLPPRFAPPPRPELTPAQAAFLHAFVEKLCEAWGTRSGLNVLGSAAEAGVLAAIAARQPPPARGEKDSPIGDRK